MDIKFMVRQGTTLSEAAWTRMRVPNALWTVKLKNVHLSAYAQVKHYLNNFKSIVEKRRGSLLITGGPGVGKDAIGAMILANAYLWGVTGLFLDIRALRQGILNREWFDQEEGLSLADRVSKVDVLVLSRIEGDEARHSMYGDAELSALVRRRAAIGNITVLTSRLGKDFNRFYPLTMDALHDIQGLELKVLGQDRRTENQTELRKSVFGHKWEVQ